MLKEKYKLAEQNHKTLLKLMPLSKESLKSLRDYYRVGLTYTSNAIEGNSLTESETKVAIEYGLTIDGKPLRDVYEAQGHAKAYDYLYELINNKKITESDICKLHEIFYNKIDSEQAGKYRKGPVFISGSKYALPPAKDLQKLMKNFVNWFNKTENTINPVEFASLVHKNFVFIHPFIDGNGRVSRLLLNLALLRAKYTIAIIPKICRADYIASLEKARVNDEDFKEFIANRVIETQNDLIRLLENSGTINLENGIINGTINLETKLIELISKNEGINTPKIIEILKTSLRTTRRYLKKLEDEGKIEFRGANKNGGFYIL